MPLLSLLDGKYRLQEYLIGATFLLQSVIYPLCKQFGFEIGEPFVVSSASSHVMLIILGNWLANNELTRRRRIYIYGLGIFGLMYRFVFTLISSETMGYVDKTWFTYCGFPSVFLAVAVFVWFKYHDWTRLKIASKRIATLASCSFGVYLIHYEVLHQICFERMGISGLSITFRLFGALLLYFAVATGVYIAKNIPLLKRIVP